MPTIARQPIFASLLREPGEWNRKHQTTDSLMGDFITSYSMVHSTLVSLNSSSSLVDGGSYGLTLKKLQENVSQWFIVVSGVLKNISKVHQNLITENVKISRWPLPVFFLHI